MTNEQNTAKLTIRETELKAHFEGTLHQKSMEPKTGVLGVPSHKISSNSV